MSIKKLKLKIAADKQRKSRNIDPEISFSSNYSQPNFDYGAFLDAKGHYVGFCSGCEKWHTGVVWLQRHSKETMALTTSTSAGAESVTEDTSASAILSKKLDGTSKVSQIGTGTGTGTDICMRAWETILLSGRYNTDQESLDEAERSGACPSALVLPAKHLLFAKDYIGMALTAGQTFLHLTAAG